MNATEKSQCKRYGIRFEIADGTIEEPYHRLSRKADAVKAARLAAKTVVGPDIVRVWVDDLCADLGITSFKTKFA